MAGRECFHCKQWVAQGEPHDCWTTTEAALTVDLTEDLREAWERLREAAAEIGDQRIYASHKSIMFSRKSCYFFVRPKREYLELCVFLGRTLKSPTVQKIYQSSKTKLAHMIRVRHRDEVEPPLTEWLKEAYDFAEETRVGRKVNQLDRVRRICQSIPGTIEKLSHGEPTFFTPKRVFAMFANNHHGDGHVAVWLPAAPGVQEALIEENPEAYFKPPYVGPSGWVGVELSKVNDEQLGAMIRESFQLIEAKSKKKKV